jgi:3-oxoacyl-[acyl-carrier-protein] synthase III
MKCRPIGIGSATPKRLVTNQALESVVETSDEWIRTRTGIGSRRVLAPDETLRQLAVTASKHALDMAGLQPTDIDLVICCTSSPDDLFGDAPSIASELACSKGTVAFDLTAACSGFLFGVTTAAQFLHNNDKMKNALVIGADALSRWVDWDDRNTCILFGDAAGAMILQRDEEQPGLLGFAAHSNGLGRCDLNLSYDGTERTIPTPDDPTTVTNGSYGTIFMNGREVYKFATREVPAVIQECLDAAELTVADVDHLLLHQANIRIMEIVADRLGMPMDKVITNLKDYGNTSAASIPLALDEAVRAGTVKKGDVIACAGFGAGLSWGSALLKWG